MLQTEQGKWVAGWGAAISRLPASQSEYLKDQTVRYVIYPTMAARAVRLHFSNEYGTEPVHIAKVFVAMQTNEEQIDERTNTQVTFGGKADLTLAPGADIVSDEVAFEVSPTRQFSVSMYFDTLIRPETGHSNGGVYVKKFFFDGDCAEEAQPPQEKMGEGGAYLFLHTIDFLTNAAQNCSAVIAFGDSITAQPWPDCLARILVEQGISNRAVIRKAIGGGRVLREYTCRSRRQQGAAGIARFERDVTQAGAERVLILHGINDLIHPSPTSRFCGMDQLPSAEELIEGYNTYIRIAREKGIRIYLATILPCPRCMKDDGVREQIRCRVNDWIRNEAAVDGVLDFEAAVWDAADHKQIAKEYDSGDHLHPSFAGAQKLAQSVPLDFLFD